MADSKRTAIHEAGHIVIAHLFGLTFESVTIPQNERDCLGHPVDIRKFDPSKQMLSEMIIYLCAGEDAEIMVYGDAQRNRVALDMEDAFDLLRAHTLGEFPFYSIGDDVYLHLLRDVSRDTPLLVRKLRPQIEAIADELLKRGTLTNEDIERILSQYILPEWATNGASSEIVIALSH